MSVPSLRKVILTWVKVSIAPSSSLFVFQGYPNISLAQDADMTLRERIEDIYRLITTGPSGSPFP